MQQPIHILLLQGCPIYDQLKLEEALLRADNRNWCLINCGSLPSIVMGISGKFEELIHQEQLQKAPVPVIRRFSGGGTVFVDEQTLFISLICNTASLPLTAYPEKILKWTEELYCPVFHELDFKLIDQDYVIGNRKCGGNAQYIRKDRWLHHTSFLWQYRPERMNYLLMPKKTPTYRQNRCHSDFLCELKSFLPSQDVLKKRFLEALKRHFHLEDGSVKEAHLVQKKEHRQTTQMLLI